MFTPPRTSKKSHLHFQGDPLYCKPILKFLLFPNINGLFIR